MPAVTSTVTFGLDISHHQNAALDLARCRREGIEFVILKATDGAGFTDPEFAANLAEARRAGLLVAAYHYQRPGSAAAQLARIRQAVPLDVPVVLDVEAGSGGVALTRDLVGQLRTAGYRVPLTYLPRWYWQQIGSPSLAGLPPLWSSRYPDNIVGSIADEWADVPAHYWNGYGGLSVALLQFTSSASIAGHHPIDANAYRGSRAQLAALLGAEEEDMPTVNEILMGLVTGTDPDTGQSETHPFAQWLTVLCFRARKTLQLAAEFAGRDPIEVDIDEAAVAAGLAPMLIEALANQLSELGDDDLQRIAKAVNDEHARRQAA